MAAGPVQLVSGFSGTRSLILMDLDNMVGGPSEGHRVPDAMARVLAMAGYRVGDHLVVAAEVVLARTAAFQLPRGARILVGRGRDGADRRLLEAVPVDLVAERYGRLVVASGDHSMIPLVQSVRALGTQVLVLGPVHGTSRALRGLADRYLGVQVGDEAA